MRVAAIALVPLLVLAAGCLQPEGNDPPTGTASDSATPTGAMCPPTCFEGHEVRLVVDVSGAGGVGVPFPHGAWCLQPSEWNLTISGGASAELRQVDRGTVLWVDNVGQGAVQASIDVKGRATCQTLRYDPWSIEPDPAEDTVDVTSDVIGLDVEVQVQDVDGSCFNATVYRGDTRDGWATLQGQTTGTACA
jgi:hypothetical protein